MSGGSRNKPFRVIELLDAHELVSPPRYKDCFRVFGDFREPDWFERNMVRCDLSELSYELGHVKLGWDRSTPAFEHNGWFGFMCHRLVAPIFQKVFRKIVEWDLHEEIWTFDGCWQIRWQKGAKKWSTHSWGVAIDLNAEWNPFGVKDRCQIPGGIVDIFEEYGFTWGGSWRRRPDPMHFQYVL